MRSRSTLHLRHHAALMLLSGSLVLGCKKAEEAKSQQATPNDAAAPEAVAESAQTHPSTQPGRIGPGDLLLIDVSDLSGPNTIDVKPVRVAADGTVQLFVLDQPMSLAGKTTYEAEGAITKAYRLANVEANAVVYVRRVQVAAPSTIAPAPIKPFDLLRVSILDINGPGTSDVRITRVDANGLIGVPYLEEHQKLVGLTDGEAELKLAAAYRAQNLIQRAMVSVLRLEVAPPGAEKMDLPDAPINPVPEVLKPLFWAGWPSPSQIPVAAKK